MPDLSAPAATVETPDRTVEPLLTPRDGLPEVVTTPEGVARAAAGMAAGAGPIAVDAERASGYRYSARAYLVQLRRAGSGTVLRGPIPAADALAPLAEAIGGAEWVLHSADQDLPATPCIAATRQGSFAIYCACASSRVWQRS